LTSAIKDVGDWTIFAMTHTYCIGKNGIDIVIARKDKRASGMGGRARAVAWG
jgi:hypothetical protein